ncbi:alpha/beta fold hydrolase [Paraburkholderia sp. EG287B]|uniref:alpha/beta fold hydrolase n=1 Tax=Paraburkholderia sp. EG287B TaxID=3237010 RepID=UPI0034D1D437
MIADVAADAQSLSSLFRAELRLEVAEESKVSIAATIVAPTNTSECSTVVFAFPGGGYGRHYFDLRHPLLEGETQAEWHARRGVAFIALDPYGGGDSTELDPSRCGIASTVGAVHGVVTEAIERLSKGTLASGLGPVSVEKSIGIGHSLGGMQLIVQQAEYASFDAIAVLGFSAIQTVVPTPDGMIAPHSSSEDDSKSLEEAWSGPFVDELANLRYAYHWENVPRALVDEDMNVGFPVRRLSALPAWITRTFPPFAKICLQEGIVAREAANISVPVFLSAGERNVLRDLRQEPTAYRKSVDISLFEITECAHMHNFSPRREAAWRKLQTWMDGI